MKSRFVTLGLVLLLPACYTPDPQVGAQDQISPQTAEKDPIIGTPTFEDSQIEGEDWGAGGDGEFTTDSAAPGSVAAFAVIYFGYDQDTLNEESMQILNQAAQRLQKETGYEVQIEGHCDERGTTEYNLALGDRRANRVKDHLVSMGVSPNRLSTISFGEERPLEEGHQAESWAKNRRAELRVPSLTH